MLVTGNSTPTDKPEANGVLSLQGHRTTVFCKNLFGGAKITKNFHSLREAKNF